MTATPTTVAQCHKRAMCMPLDTTQRPFRRLLVAHMFSAVNVNRHVSQDVKDELLLYKQLSDGVSVSNFDLDNFD